MKRVLAVAALFALFVSPVLADTAAPAAAAPAAAADAAAPAADAVVVPKAKKAKPAGDEAGIKAAFKTFSENWAAGDAKALALLFTTDGSLINPFGQEAMGRAEIEKVIGGDLAMMKGSTHSLDNLKFHFILPGCALVDATGTVSGLKNADGTAAADMSVHVYAVMAMRGKKWQILALRPYAFVKAGAMTAAPAAAAAAAPPAAAAVPPMSATVSVPASK